jgi:hypothetical protein
MCPRPSPSSIQRRASTGCGGPGSHETYWPIPPIRFSPASRLGFSRSGAGALGSLLCATAYMLVCWMLGYVFDRRNIVVSL